MSYGDTKHSLSLKQEIEITQIKYEEFEKKLDDQKPENGILVYPRLPLEVNLPEGTIMSVFQKMIKNIDKDIEKDNPYFIKNISFMKNRDSFNSILRKKRPVGKNPLTALEVLQYLKESEQKIENGTILFAGSFYKGTHKKIVSVPVLLVEDDYFELTVISSSDTCRKQIFFGERFFPETTH